MSNGNLETPPFAKVSDGTTQLSLRLRQIFGLAQKSLEGSHEEALNLMRETRRAVTSAEMQAAELRIENSRLCAALEMQRKELQSESADHIADMISEVKLPPKISSIILPPGEAPPLPMDPHDVEAALLPANPDTAKSSPLAGNLNTAESAPSPTTPDTAESSPLRLPGMANSCENGQAQQSQFSEEVPQVNPVLSEGATCTIVGEISQMSISMGKLDDGTECYAHRPLSKSSRLEESPRCSKCRISFLPDATFCHKCGVKSPAARDVSKGVITSKSRSMAHAYRSIDSFKLLDVWEGEEEKITWSRSMRSSSSQSPMNSYKTKKKTFAADGLASMTLYDEQLGVPPFCKTGIIHPSSMMRGAWDLSSLALVSYDIIMIPLDSFFEPPQNWFTVMCSWIVRLFWTFDIGLSFVTGYYERDGSIVLERPKIIRRYIYSWFVLDCLVVGVDWCELIARSMTSEVGYARIGKVGRSFRIIRMVRLLRLVRMREIVDLICERINSEKLLLLAHITKLMVMIMMIAHIVACCWYGIGNTGSSRSWVTRYGFADKPWGDRYAMSLHWSVSQFTGGMDEITPENPGERVYAMGVLIITFIIAALFISTLASSMTQLELLGSTNSQLLSNLRQYLHQKQISSKLSMRVQRNAQHQMKEEQRNCPEDRIALLKAVSEPLRIELHFEIHSPALSCHPFFKSYIKECPQVMRKVCHKAARSVSVSTGDVIFSAGTSPANPQMYFITDGLLDYSNKAAANWTQNTLQKGEWVAEAVLWVQWIYRGDLIAQANSSYCMLEARHFQETVNEFHHHNTIAKAYAASFVARLNCANRIGGFVSDLHIPMEEEVVDRRRTKGLFKAGTVVNAGSMPTVTDRGSIQSLQ